jgi:ABC-type glutathione transport system ATPase component
MVEENDMTLDSEIERLGEQTDDLRTNGAQVTTTAAVSQPSGLTGTEAMIDVEGVGKAFGSVQALVAVSLRVQAGRVVGLLGPNGAGKTTLVRILTTLLQPDSGQARGSPVSTSCGTLLQFGRRSGWPASTRPSTRC